MPQGTILSFIFAGIMAINLVLWIVSARGKAAGRPIFAPQWSVADLWFGAQWLFAALILAVSPLLVQIPGDDLEKSLTNPTVLRNVILPMILVQNLVFFAVPALYIVRKYGLKLREIGLPLLPRRRDWAAGLILGVVIFVLVQGLGIGLTALAEQFSAFPAIKAMLDYEKSNPVAQIAGSLSGVGKFGAIVGVIGFGIAAPIGEEMLFRAFAFNILRRRFGLVAGILISALIFTVGHTYAIGLPVIFVMGCLLAWTYYNSGSLWIPILIHCVNNTASIALALIYATPK